jgi:hypothetical protein
MLAFKQKHSDAEVVQPFVAHFRGHRDLLNAMREKQIPNPKMRKAFSQRTKQSHDADVVKSCIVVAQSKAPSVSILPTPCVKQIPEIK